MGEEERKPKHDRKKSKKEVHHRVLEALKGAHKQLQRCPQTAHNPGRDLIFLSKVSLIVIRNSKLSSALTFEISGQGISCATRESRALL